MNNLDITARLLRIKENISAIEAGDVRAPLLDEVRSDFLELVESIKLFLISERDSYYGYFMMNMQFRANFESDSIAGIKLNEFPAVFEANPLLLCKFTLKEIIYIFCHEIDHVVYNHPAEMLKSNPDGDPDIFYQFNLAADAAVNDRINYEIKSENHIFMKSPDGLITSMVLSKMYKLGKILEMENYAYYFGLIAQKSQKDDNMPVNSPQNGASSMMQQQNSKDGTGEGEGFEPDENGDIQGRKVDRNFEGTATKKPSRSQILYI